METFLQDLRYGVRMLRARPGFTVVALIALALGIGANSAIFSVVNTVLLRPLPYEEPERLVNIWASKTKAPDDRVAASAPNFFDWRDQNRVFTGMAAYLEDAYNLTGRGEPLRVKGVAVSGTMFSMLGVNPATGRNFLPEEDVEGASKVVILSQSLWQQSFGADPNVLGQSVDIDSESYAIVGVMPPAFSFPDAETALWMPLAVVKPSTWGRMDLFFNVVARLKPGVSIEQAQSDMDSVAGRLAEQYPASNAGWGVMLVPLHEQAVGDVRPALLVLFGAVGFVLLIACANVANLLLARAASRQREIAIRSALGASRWRVIRQLVTESLMLSLMGGALGLLLALWGGDILATLSTENLPRAQEIGIDGLVLGFTCLLSIMTGLIFGLVPALQVSKPNLSETLKEGGRSSTGGVRSQFLRSALVVTEVALSLVLLVGAGLLIKSFVRLQQVEPGFESANRLTLEVALPWTKYPGQEPAAAFFERALDRIEVLPGVQSVGATTALPFSGRDNWRLFYIEGRPHSGPQDYTGVGYRAINSGYFRALGIPLVQGRDFTEQDRSGVLPVVIVNQAMARKFFPGEDPSGKRFKMGGGPESKNPWLTVVGVAADVKHSSLDAEAKPEIFLPYLQAAQTAMHIVVHTAGDPGALTAAIRQEVRAVDPDQPVSKVATMEQLLSDSVAPRRFNLLLLGIFAAVALILAAVGIYGVMSYAVTQHTHEIGIRQALGARPVDVLKLVLGQGMRLALAGVVIGLAGAFALTRVMESLLFDVSATDPLTFAVIALLLTGVAAMACFVPARRATRVDPMVALRYE
ncbi:MAG: ABC transporter permease [Blastocatellia bacterium]|nr:ABC transporter permease [Blastocatellia bacterium]